MDIVALNEKEKYILFLKSGIGSIFYQLDEDETDKSRGSERSIRINISDQRGKLQVAQIELLSGYFQHLG